mmetsp:Transcript_7290/g.9230  ORF Transcript_7290/g.9230 Transcript_7290/m.9230 type:complete len:357 (+) Transcript_7290:155-1225(+)
MSLSNILQHVKRKGQIIPKTNRSDRDETSEANRTAEQLNNRNQYRYSNGENRVVDPVVARLKAARKLEREKKEQESREKKGLSPKKPKSAPRSAPRNTSSNGLRSTETKRNIGGGRSNNSGISTSTNMRPNIAPSHKPVKKMNFNDLMKKASKIDQSKLSVSIKPKAKSPEVRSTAVRHKPVSRASSAPTEGHANVPKRNEARPISKYPNSDDSKHSARAPLPVRKPSSKLEERLKSSGKTKPSNSQYSRSQSYNDSEDEDAESFIISDDEEIDNGDLNAPDYDRDEIWAIFNRGKKRSYYDRYDDESGDDMEATGAEIWEEEMRSKRNAELEDRRELEEEQRLAALKKARKMKQH